MTSDNKRRALDNLEILDTQGKLTDGDLETLKEIAHYWQAGKITAGVVLTLGGFGIVVAGLWDHVLRWIK